MGKNKHLRILIAGQVRAIAVHQAKILAELEAEQPNLGRIRKGEREIDNAGKRVRELEERLEK